MTTSSEFQGERWPFEVSIETLVKFLGLEALLYSEDEQVFIRELVQNAIDAIVVRHSLEKLCPPGRITITHQNGTVTVADNGYGLDKDGMRNLAHPLLGIIDCLGERLDTSTRSKIIGRFGAGLLSVFKVSDQIVIESKRKRKQAWQLKVGIEHLSDGQENRLKLDSWLYPSKRRKVGTEVAVHFGCHGDHFNQEVQSRGREIDDSSKILEAIRYYVKRLPKEVELVFINDSGRKTCIESQPYFGEDIEPHREIKIAGTRGWLAFQQSRDECLFRVCQRGILVRDNYSALLPPETISIVGEADLQTTEKLSLKPSREEFVENEKYKTFRRQLSEEIELFMKDEVEAWLQTVRTDDSPKPRSSKDGIEEDSRKALEYLTSYQRSDGDMTLRARLENGIAFEVTTKDIPSGRHMYLHEIELLCKKMNERKVYVYTRDENVVTRIGNLDGSTLFEKACFRDLHAQVVVEQGGILLTIHKRGSDAPTFLPIVKSYLEEKGQFSIQVVDMGSDSSIENQIDDFELRLSPNKDIRAIKLSSTQDRRVFRNTGGNWKSKTRINVEHPRIKAVLSNLGRIQADDGKQAVYQAYINLLSGYFDPALDLLEEFLVDSHKKKVQRSRPRWAQGFRDRVSLLFRRRTRSRKR